MTTTLEQLTPSQIRPHPANPRADVGDVDELAASITEQGILEPLIVAPLPDEDRGDGVQLFRLLAGHRRLKAATQAGLATVPCIVRADLTDPARQLETMLVENLQRADLTPVEEATAYQQLLEFPGYTEARVAKATGRSRATVRQRLGLARLGDEVRDRVHRGQVTLTDAQVLVEFADDPAATEKLEAALGSSNWRWTVEQLQRERTEAKALAKAQKQLRGTGVRVVTADDLEALVDALPEDADTTDAWVYVVASEDDADSWDLVRTPEQHATCPGHAALIEMQWGADGRTRVPATTWVCTQPAEHPELQLTDGQQTVDGAISDVEGRRAAEQAARAAEEAERDRIRAGLAAAAAARRHHLAEFLRTGDTGTAAEAALRDFLYREVDQQWTAREVLADVLLPGRANDEGLTGQLADRFKRLTLEQLAICVDIASHAHPERLLTLEDGWGPDRHSDNTYLAKQTLPWRGRIEAVYGYEWSDFERSLLTPAPADTDDAAAAAP